jgi:hypothetical protein
MHIYLSAYDQFGLNLRQLCFAVMKFQGRQPTLSGIAYHSYASVRTRSVLFPWVLFSCHLKFLYFQLFFCRGFCLLFRVCLYLAFLFLRDKIKRAIIFSSSSSSDIDSCIPFLGRTRYLNTQFLFFKFIRYKLHV